MKFLFKLHRSELAQRKPSLATFALRSKNLFCQPWFLVTTVEESVKHYSAIESKFQTVHEHAESALAV